MSESELVLSHKDFRDANAPSLDWRREIVTRVNSDTKNWILNAADERAARSGCVMDLEVAEQKIEWIEENCYLYEGDKAGEPIELIPFWREYLIRMFGWQRWSRQYQCWVRRFRNCRIWVGKKQGKALALDTPIPTPGGWSTMGDILPGDVVFDAEGKPTKVLAVSEVMTGHDCYRVEFTDGSSIVADAGHLWEVTDRKDDGRSRDGQLYVKTTEELASCVGHADGYRWGLPQNSELSCDHQELPIDPYLLGYWLGNGNSDDNRITSHSDDVDHVCSKFVSLGASCAIQSRKGKSVRFAVNLSDSRLRTELAKIEVLKNKHIPQVYMRSSSEQRWNLLRGLMDSDGTCSPIGDCSFSSMNFRLAVGFVELARSLGIKCRFTKKIAKINGREIGDSWTVRFHCYQGESCFSLDRKTVRLKSPPATSTRSRVRRISAIVPVKSVPVKCIRVDNPRQLYLAGEGMVATHNSPTLAACGLLLAFGENEAGMHVYTAAKDGQQAMIAQKNAAYMVEQSPSLSRKCQIYRNTWEITDHFTRSNVKIVSSGSERTEKSKEGFNGSVIIDEVHVVDESLYTRLEKAGASRREPMILGFSTAGLDKNCFGKKQFDYGRMVNSGEQPEDEQNLEFLHVDYALPEKLSQEEFDKEPFEHIKRCNPGYGYTVNADFLISEWNNSKADPVKRSHFLVYHTTTWMDAVTKWLNDDHWRAGEEQYDLEMLKAMKPVSCVLGFDYGYSTDMTGAVFAFDFFDEKTKLSTVRLWPLFFLPEDRIRVLAQNYPFVKWAGERHIIATNGRTSSNHDIKKVIREVARQVDLDAIYYDPARADEITMELVDGELDDEGDVRVKGFGCKRVAFAQTLMNYTEPCWKLTEELRDGRIKHPGNPVLNWQAGHIEVYSDLNRNIRPVKPEDQEYTGKSIDGIVAAIMAVEGVRQIRAKTPGVYFGAAGKPAK